MRVSIAVIALATIAALAPTARAQPPEAIARVTIDRVAVRFYSPETGGSARPRFISERTLACEARFEALADDNSVAAAYEERYLRAAMERHVAEEILATLIIEQGGSLYRLDRGAFTAIANGGWTQPAITPDHQHLVAVKRVGNVSDLFELDLNGQVQRQITSDNGRRHGSLPPCGAYPRAS